MITKTTSKSTIKKNLYERLLIKSFFVKVVLNAALIVVLAFLAVFAVIPTTRDLVLKIYITVTSFFVPVILLFWLVMLAEQWNRRAINIRALLAEKTDIEKALSGKTQSLEKLKENERSGIQGEQIELFSDIHRSEEALQKVIAELDLLEFLEKD